MNKLTFKKVLGLALTPLTVLSFSACTNTESPDASKPSIVATTNVWADVANQVAGDYFEVTSLINKPTQDPHSFEASARDQLAVSEAELFIMNGGGYDDFAIKLASAANVEPFNVFENRVDAHAEVHTEEEHHAEEEHHHEHNGQDHIWYDLHVVEHTAELIAEELAKVQPQNADEFKANAAAFATEIAALEERAATLKGNLNYFEAHPLASLLFAELGFQDLTPEGFAEAEEAELEPSPLIMNEATELIEQGSLDFLAVNRQVTSISLDKLKATAQEQGLRIVELDELLPDGANYQQWFGTILDQIEAAK
jgi:zinc/manganese transport system substrate-binding protein